LQAIYGLPFTAVILFSLPFYAFGIFSLFHPIRLSTVHSVYVKDSPRFKYSDVNQALWDWYTMCRNSNIPVSGSMLQAEATLIAEKLEFSDFVASNGCLEKFKQKYSICNKTVAGKAGDVGKR